MKPNKKITAIVTGGGTGGHVYPAIAIAQALEDNENVEKVYYAGSKLNMEYNIATNLGFEFLDFKVHGMPRKISFSFIGWFLEVLAAYFKAILVLSKIKPDIIVGTGGYVSAPSLMAASALKIPIVIHDPDAHPGVVNRFISNYASIVSVAFEGAKKYFKNTNIILNGNPLRDIFRQTSKREAVEQLGLDENKNTLLVMGGSQGAKSINTAISEIAKVLVEEKNIQIIHQTGKKNYDIYIEQLEKNWAEYKNSQSIIIQPYFEDMSIPLAAADIVISRAGSMSISEIHLNGLPAILIPYPHAAANHQYHNAKAFEANGAGMCIEDKDCSGTLLLEKITELFENKETLAKMKENNLSLSTPNATKNIVEQVIKLSLNQ